MTRRAARVATFALECGIVLAVLAAASATYVYVQSEQRLGRVYSTATPHLEIPPSDPEIVERGRHLAVHVGLCTWCHSDDLSGKEMADDVLVGQLHASNLTSGAGGIAHYEDRDLVRAIRHGVTPDGRSLLLMPSQYLRSLTDRDLAAIVAWLRSVDPVDSVRPATHAGPLTRMALVTGLAPELIAAEPGKSRPAGDPADLGAYLVDVASCRVCHHADLAGGLHPLSLPDEPPPPDLRASGPLASWSFDEFQKAMRTGATPDGRTLAPEYMPWPHYAGMTDTELRAIWRYLKSLGATRSSEGSTSKPRV